MACANQPSRKFVRKLEGHNPKDRNYWAIAAESVRCVSDGICPPWQSRRRIELSVDEGGNPIIEMLDARR